MIIEKKLRGKWCDHDIFEYTVTNSNNLSFSVISYGAIITNISMPDRQGNIENITVNVKTLDEIIQNRPFHGAIVGPVAGRISNGEYKENESIIQLTKNEFSNTLHSGHFGLDTKLWEINIEKTQQEVSLICKTTHLDGEDGFLGNIEVVVIYKLNENNEFTISYEATSDKKTIFNPTNHVYFNLSGNNKENIFTHQIQINSDNYAVLDEENLPTGELRPVRNSSFDLRNRKMLKEVILSEEKQIKNIGGLDHPFVLNQDSSQPEVTVQHEKSGRKIEMTTTSDSVVIYTHNHEHEPKTQDNDNLHIYSGVTLETQILPDAVNNENFGSIWLNPNKKFTASTIFKFSVI